MKDHKSQRQSPVNLWTDSIFAKFTNQKSKVEAVLRMCSAKMVFLKFSQNSQGNNCTGVTFIFIKKWLQHKCFPVNFAKF